MLVELGPGTNPHPRTDIGIDRHHPIASPAQDATVTPWVIEPRSGAKNGALHPDAVNLMLAGESVDEVYASHFMEHVPKGQPLIDVMNEAWRVLRPGGTFTMIMPLVGYTSPHAGTPESDHIGWQPWADPTHVSHWWLPEALMYFCEGPFKPHANYGLQTWAPLGPYRPEAEASAALDALTRNPVPEMPSFWSVRSGWEGVARLVKP